jgi:hypothetical protein
MSGADLDLVVRARRAVRDGALRRTWLRGRPCPSAADGEPAGRLITRTGT